MDQLSVPFEVKEVSDSGVIYGYASTFGNVDLGRDVVEPGAFQESIDKQNGKVTVLWQHNWDEPVGVGEINEDRHGLRVKTNMVMEVSRAKEAHALAKAGAVKAFSIGFITKDFEFDDLGIRHIKKADLMEYSLVTFPMNPQAQITHVKARAGMTEREFEEFLRDAGFSRSEAKTIVGHGFKSLRTNTAGKAEAASEVISSVEELMLRTLTQR